MDPRFHILDGTELIACNSEPDGWDGYEQIALVGEWKGHWQGSFQITSAMLRQMRDFGNSRKVGTVVDYGHASIFDSSADAAGWIEPGRFRVDGRGDATQLMAQVSWNAKALEKIAAGELRYKSPTIVWNTQDRKTGRTGGASLHSVALTNTPFLTELPEVRVNQIMSALAGAIREEHPMNEEQIRRLAKLLGLAEDATADQIIITASERATALHEVAQLLGGTDIISRVRELQTSSTIAEAIAELEAKVETFEQAEKDKTSLELVRTYQAKRKVAADDTPNFKASLAQAKADPEGFKALMESTAAWVAGGDQEQRDTESSTADIDLDEGQRAMNKRLGVSDETFKKFHNGLPTG
jgi:phage I-like protein